MNYGWIQVGDRHSDGGYDVGFNINKRVRYDCMTLFDRVPMLVDVPVKIKGRRFTKRKYQFLPCVYDHREDGWLIMLINDAPPDRMHLYYGILIAASVLIQIATLVEFFIIIRGLS